MQLHHFNTPSVTHTFIQCFYLDITLHTWSTGVTSWFSILLNGASDHWWEEPSIQPSNQPQLPPKDRKNNARILTADKKQSTATWRLTRDLRMTTDDPKKGDRNIYTLRVFKKSGDIFGSALPPLCIYHFPVSTWQCFSAWSQRTAWCGKKLDLFRQSSDFDHLTALGWTKLSTHKRERPLQYSWVWIRSNYCSQVSFQRRRIKIIGWPACFTK